MTDYAANVKTYGAVGDGVADDTAAIQATINSQRDVYLPNGTYKVTSTLSIPTAWKNSFSMVGETVIGVTINYSGTGACFKADPSPTPSTTTRRNYWYIANLLINGPGAGVAGSIGLHINNALAGTILNVKVVSFETGVKFDGLNLANATACYYNGAYNLHATSCGTAVHFAGQANSNQMFGGQAFASLTGVKIDPLTTNITLHGVAVEGNTTCGLSTAGYGGQFIGCRLENPNATYEVKFDDSGGGTNGTKNAILSYWTNPSPEARISWDATRNNIVLWPGQFNDPAASSHYTAAYGATVTLTPSNGNNANVTATGNLTLAVSTTNAVDSQTVTCAVLASGVAVGVTTTIATKLTTGMTSPFSIPSGKVGVFTFRYSALLSAWVLVSQKNTL